MPAPLPAKKRQAIEKAIQAGKLSRNAIARKHHASRDTVSRIAKGLEDTLEAPAFDRTPTKKGTEARQADLAARRAELAGLLIEDAFRFREAAHEGSFPVVVGGVNNPHVIMVAPNTNDVRNLYIAIGVAVDKSRVLSGDADDPAEQGRAAVLALLDELRAS